MNGIIYLEIFLQNAWQNYAELKVNESKKSSFSATAFDYEIEFVSDHLEHEGALGLISASVHLPLGMNSFLLKNWPSFLLDLIPQGPARTQVCKREKIIDNQENDFLILLRGAINPIGNIRIKNDLNLFSGEKFLGLTYEDIIEKNDRFVDHAVEMGALVAGGSGAQGMALKFLVNTDQNGLWHCDGALRDDQVRECFLVKFPRGKTENDKLILEAEKHYMDIARELKLKANSTLLYDRGILFIPRFDRKVLNGKLLRFGVESMSSALGQTQFGLISKIEDQIKVIKKFSSAPQEDILEFVGRDFLSIVLGNTDNHSRNTAFLKTDEQTVRLSPLFDFAPMVMDEEMIPRASKWEKEMGHIPDFDYVATFLKSMGISEKNLESFFKTWDQNLQALPALFKTYGLREEVVTKATKKLSSFHKALSEYLGKAHV